MWLRERGEKPRSSLYIESLSGAELRALRGDARGARDTLTRSAVGCVLKVQVGVAGVELIEHHPDPHLQPGHQELDVLLPAQVQYPKYNLQK
ncbi:hypothetical protein EYF80_033513 [Liparis tanakae]|uniref:Uncharacterized protein n=1 Tax=Liparis tanakae TaxID=230148 RepID=A0A4Z2GRV9_9TELE|nr:hypothetical protein EYF80_033513 [Liparis tanakae]